MKSDKSRKIRLTKSEIQSGSDRQEWAEGLILQLPASHDGRNSWLLNYGRSTEAEKFRDAHFYKPKWSDKYSAAQAQNGKRGDE